MNIHRITLISAATILDTSLTACEQKKAEALL
jgi:hypothetical protein